MNLKNKETTDNTNGTNISLFFVFRGMVDFTFLFVVLLFNF